MTADAPESDFGVVAPETPVRVHVLASGRDIDGRITRRAPAADPGTRTVHFEIDIPDPARRIPVNTTGEVHVNAGEPVAATQVPLYTATQSGDRATLFTIEGDLARAEALPVLGEVGGRLYFAPDVLKAGTRVVAEGRALLTNGQKVTAKEVAPAEHGSSATVIAEPAPGAPGAKP